ncbi:MAG: dipeptide epimerase [Planctomycetes bacterium RBG_13_63_9]|nr:MAG: dipeptide epimerase [Planctomycetes bacterium RBG_13_63_9]
MQIVELSSYVIRLPLRREVKHASATRRASDNLVVRCLLADGTEGWGEGVPRPYVTGETPEGAMAQLAATPLAEQLGPDAQSWSDVFAICDRFEPPVGEDDPRGSRANALRCAVELSILDAFARRFDEPLRAVTQQFEPARALCTSNRQVRYSAVITAEAPRAERISALKMRLYGFAQCKVKVGMASAGEADRLRRIRRWLGRRMDLRLDANGAWRGSEAAGRIEPLLACNVSCVEQPVPHEEVESLAEVRRQVPLPLMLDESLTSLSDAREAIRLGTCDLFNIRLSKCGGFLNCLRLAALARSAGLDYQLGCHPGESGILSAAGRHWATSVSEIRYLEGSYDRHLLREQLTKEDITFGYGGRAPALSGPGLGVTVDPKALARLTVQRQTQPLR